MAITLTGALATVGQVGTEGFIKIGSVIIQWGSTTVPTNSGQPVTFPIPFPTAVLQSYCTSHTFNPGAVNSSSVGTDNISLTGMNCFSHEDGVAKVVSWLAIGH